MLGSVLQYPSSQVWVCLMILFHDIRVLITPNVPPQRTGLGLGSELSGYLCTVDINIFLQTSVEIVLTSLNKISFKNLG